MSNAAFGADLRFIISENPTVFTFNGVEYTGIISGKNLRQPLELGGFQDEPELTLVFPIYTESGSFTVWPLPATGKLVTIDGRAYRIDRTERDADDCGYQMDLRSANK